VWVVVVAVAHVWGVHVFADRPGARVPWPPLVAQWRPAFDLWGLVPVLAAVAAVGVVPRLAVRLSWRPLLAAGFLAAVGWAVALALADGPHGLTAPLSYPADYLNDVGRVGDLGSFLRGFVPNIDTFAQHVRAHPPGMVLLLSLMDRVSLRGPGWEAGLVIGGGSAAVPAAMIAVREVADEASARIAAPFLAISPAAVYVATSGDALFMGVAAWAVTLAIMATGRHGRAGDALAVGGGLLLGVASMLSYGLALVALIPLPVAVARRRARPLVLAAVGWGVVIAAFAGAGFRWWDGLEATTEQYGQSIARHRPQGYFWFGNLAAFAVVIGPAGCAGLAELRDRRIWLLAAGALAAMVLADATGLSRGETERIWLVFVPWVLVACSALARTPLVRVGDHRARASPEPSAALLASNVAIALALQLLLGTTW
jgi:hypothetical protein